MHTDQSLAANTNTQLRKRHGKAFNKFVHQFNKLAGAVRQWSAVGSVRLISCAGLADSIFNIKV